MEQVVMAILGAMLYALVSYAKSAKAEEFNLVKFAATIITGAIIGAILYYNGVEITFEQVEYGLVAYAGLVMIIENIIKAVVRTLRAG